MSKNTKGKLSDDNKTQTKIDKFFPKTNSGNSNNKPIEKSEGVNIAEKVVKRA